MTSDCAFCTNNELIDEELPPRERAYVGDHWRVVVNKSALPGWLLVICRRHIETMADLSAEEAASLGLVLAEGTRALAQVVRSVKSYAMLFAEGTKHVHFSLVPRMANIPDHLKGAAVSGYNAEGSPLSDERRDEIAEELGAVWHALVLPAINTST